MNEWMCAYHITIIHHLYIRKSFWNQNWLFCFFFLEPNKTSHTSKCPDDDDDDNGGGLPFSFFFSISFSITLDFTIIFKAKLIESHHFVEPNTTTICFIYSMDSQSIYCHKLPPIPLMMLISGQFYGIPFSRCCCWWIQKFLAFIFSFSFNFLFILI